MAAVRELVFDGLSGSERDELDRAVNRILVALCASDLPLAPTLRRALDDAVTAE